MAPQEVGGAKPKQLLESLLLERGRLVGKDELADRLWAEGAPVNTVATIETYVSVLRRRLPDGPRLMRDLFSRRRPTTPTPSILVAAGVALIGLVLLAAPAAASCASAVSVATAVSAAPVAFVGTVTVLESGGRVATVQVSDVWKGTSVGAVVRMVGTPDLGAAATSADRTYASGQQYLFVPVGGSTTDFQDNQCTATQPYSSSLAALRPAAAPGAPAPTAFSGDGFPMALVAVAVGLAAAAMAVAAFIRRRRVRMAGTLI